MVIANFPVTKDASLENLLAKEMRSQVSRGAYLSRKSKVKNTQYFEFGICTPRMILAEDSPPLLKYINIDSVFSVSASVKNKTFEVEYPERSEIHDKLVEKRGNLVRKAENALVANLGPKLVNIPKVQNGLNPIKEILLALHELGRIDYSEICSRKGRSRAEQYVKFLQDLQFVKLENNVVYPGNELSKYDLADFSSTQINQTLLNDVISTGFRFLKENLKIYILTPYLELSNAYYLQSYFAKKLLKLNYLEISRHYNDMYGRPRSKPPYQIYANLVEMKQAAIIEGEHGKFSGLEDIFSGFERQMDIAFQ